MSTEQNLPRVVIVVGGFGGLNAARALKHAPVKIVLIDRVNHHLFQPLLYQVATSVLPPTEIAAPMRHLPRNQRNVTVLMGEVNGVDTAQRVVHVAEIDQPAAYDFLVVATGAQGSYFGHDEWEPYAPALKTVANALSIRNRTLKAFELAEIDTDPERRTDQLTFVIVVGDTAYIEEDGKPLPGVAQIAIQSGQYAAHVIWQRVKSRSPPPPFKYFDKGNMATVTRGYAIVDSKFMRTAGFIGKLAWAFLHILYLSAFEDRIIVFFRWTWEIVTNQRGARVIYNAQGSESTWVDSSPE